MTPTAASAVAPTPPTVVPTVAPAVAPTVAPSATPVPPPSPTVAAAPPSATPAAAPETVYVFNVGSKDVTLLDAETRKVRETRPLGAQVRWLTPDVSYWDGERIWTFDHPDNRVEAIAIDPKALQVTKSIKELGAGPAHSLVLLPDKRKAAVNVAGDDTIAFLDLPSGQIEAKLKTGAFP